MDCTKCYEIEKRLEKRLEKLEKGHDYQALEIEKLKVSSTSSGEQLRTLFRIFDEIKAMIRESNENMKEAQKQQADIQEKNYTELKKAFEALKTEIDTLKVAGDKSLADKTRKIINIFITVLVTALATGIITYITMIITRGRV